MRFRGKSIRRKIVALLLVPLVSLSIIWIFTTVLTGREAERLFHTSHIAQDIGYPLEDTVGVLQQERRQTLLYLADPRAADALTALRRNRSATDEAIAEIRGNAGDPSVRDDWDASDGERMTAVLDAFDGIASLRRGVEDGTIDRSQAFDLYNHVVDPCYALLAGLDGMDDVDMDKEARALVNIKRARELLSREDALLGSSLVVGRLSAEETREITDLVAQRTLLYDISLPLLPATERERYERFWKNATTAPLRLAEESVTTSADDVPRGVSAESWDAAAGNTLRELGTLDDQADDHYQERIHPVAVEVIVRAAVAGLLGLIALLASLVLSVRIGRGLVRDLRQLRLEAQEAAGVRLPNVMRRLSTGEKIDVETEAPRLEYDKNEIGEVGRALDTLQRAAVEAAVKQAELRSGISEVFVNLARRSQVLLHKQLTLLDSMERRTEDTDELADLFRLDHLTTRMRRHAEGLVILSGAVPSRQWRKPVQLMDVVRAAVAEVEDYERIEVRRLPRTAITGPAVADLTHLVAELLENATVFSPPHTAVQVLGERVANGFTLEIHDRGLGMPAEALLDANLRLAETPDFELSDTDRLGLFVVSRLAQRQNVRVSLQPSPYGGITAIVFIPDVVLTDDVQDTNGLGFRIDRERGAEDAAADRSRQNVLTQAAPQPPGLPASLLAGPVEPGPPVDLDAIAGFPGALADDDSDSGGLFHRRSLGDPDSADPHSAERAAARTRGRRHPSSPVVPAPDGDEGAGGPAALPRRPRTPKLVSSHGRPVDEHGEHDGPRSRRGGADEAGPAGPRASAPEALPPLPSRRRTKDATHLAGAVPDTSGRTPTTQENAPEAATGSRAAAPNAAPDGRARASGPPALPRRTRSPESDSGGTGPAGGTSHGAGAKTGSLPRRVRQASLAPQLRDAPDRVVGHDEEPAERDAEEVRSRMASLQRGWRRGREENAAGDESRNGAAPGTNKGDGP